MNRSCKHFKTFHSKISSCNITQSVTNKLTVNEKIHRKWKTTKPTTGNTTTHNEPKIVPRVHTVKHWNLSNEYAGRICRMSDYYCAAACATTQYFSLHHEIHITWSRIKGTKRCTIISTRTICNNYTHNLNGNLQSHNPTPYHRNAT
jgi:hypothetical protein